MKKARLLLSGLLAVPTLAFMPVGNSSTAYGGENVSFIDNVTPYLVFRPRYEFVDDNVHKNANALTIRTVIGTHIGSVFGIKGLKAQIEATNVSAFIDNYNSTSAAGNNNPKYAVVIDPPITRITQANLTYTTGKTTFIVGRKMVTLDNHRFIGNVGWRQMPQTYGVIAVVDNSIKNLNLLGALVYERLGIKDELNTEWSLGDAPILLHASYTVSKALKVTAYDYMLTDIHDTYGLRLTGITPVSSGIKISYVAEYAKQTNPTKKDKWNSATQDVDSYYYNIGIGGYMSGFILGAHLETLGEYQGNKAGGKGFSTPLATAHKFQGWSDVLLPLEIKGNPNGLRDFYISAGYKAKDFGKGLIRFHRYRSVGGSDYGNEWEFLYVRKLTKRLGFLAKAALYKAGDDLGFPVNDPTKNKDVSKYWLQLVYKY